tara:strand:- start:225 stop:404 length:180 start_codon:yes stop_codon:yes gene_type:complete
MVVYDFTKMPKRIDYILIGKELLANINGIMYRTVLNKQKVVKLIGDKYESKYETKRSPT